VIMVTRRASYIYCSLLKPWQYCLR
jgi:hypothetical protein